MKTFLGEIWGDARFVSSTLIFSLLTCIAPVAKSQGTLDALTIPAISGAPVTGYTVGGAGWSFVPTTDILVTGVEASAPLVIFWQNSYQNMATFSVSSPSLIPANSFDSITPLLLSAGQVYYVSCQNSSLSDAILLTGWALPGTGSPPPYGTPPFSISPYISQFASYFLSSAGQWTLPPGSSSNNLYYGPNFQFQVVPEPSTGSLAFLGLGLGLFSRTEKFRRLFRN